VCFTHEGNTCGGISFIPMFETQTCLGVMGHAIPVGILSGDPNSSGDPNLSWESKFRVFPRMSWETLFRTPMFETQNVVGIQIRVGNTDTIYDVTRPRKDYSQYKFVVAEVHESVCGLCLLLCARLQWKYRERDVGFCRKMEDSFC